MIIDKIKKVNKIEEKPIKNDEASEKMIGKWVKCNNCKEIIYKLYSSRIKSKILCDEDCNKRSGECRRYFSRSKADQ